jgi:hypothetical protein
MGQKFITRINRSDEHDFVITSAMSMSNKIRALYGHGMPRVQIAEELGIRYQWVRNVLTQPVKNKS